MLRFVVRRVLLTGLILLGVSLVVFLVTKLIPGDPVASLLGPNATPEAHDRLVVQMGLNRPLPVQYGAYLWLVLHGDLGRSIAQQTPVLGLILSAFGNTLILAGFASLLAVAGGVGLGTVAAVWRDSPLARAVSGITLFSVSAPQYVVAVLLVVLFAVQTRLLDRK